ncbi:MAG: preprotein translocase subunit SecA [Actinomycetota bacterium]|nr:preprotein translocase subunit SecA [Actinomycetota bacterium]MDA3013527.1 preprotein translocase subunit SecA [Actinomycetota bacterium]
MNLFKKVLSAGSGKFLNELNKIVDAINQKEQEYSKLSDLEVKQNFQDLKEKINGDPKNIEVEAFAYVREASKRTLGQRHYDVQLFGGLVLLRNKIAEMKTGEGKTLVSTLPISLMALFSKGVHVVTVNEYLAKRDAEWMAPIYNFLGLEVGLIYSNQDYEEKRMAYKKDITYGTNNEFGFDYLRDNMAVSKEQLVQGELFYSVIDEVDSILVDEARTPLIISGKVGDSTKWYTEFSKIVKSMQKDIHYEVDEAKKQVHPTEVGVEYVESRLGINNLYEDTQTNFIHYLTASLRAKSLFQKDVDYIISDGQVKIVDEFTGRVLDGRRYSDGLHQALEAKENVRIQDENQTLASITYQNYFRMYENLSGMTGTAKTEEEELIQIYNLEPIEIPTNLPIQRKDQQDAVYKTKEAKLKAVVEDIKQRHENGQPVLLGTVSVEASEEISKKLTSKGIKHSVLNAKKHEQEAGIIAQAGRVGAVTVATNMAGRGVDIKLGGNAEEMALQAQIIENKLEDVNFYFDKLKQLQPQVVEERKKVLELGGLYVLGTERHESRRIDNQLRGRSGRQGDPGESRFYISLQDDLMRRFQGERIEAIMNKLNLPDEERIEQSMVTKSIERAQAQVESLNFEIRKNVLKFDQVLNQQREVIYKWRRQLLKSDSIEKLITDWLEDVIAVIDNNISESKKNYKSLEEFSENVEIELSEILSDPVKKKILRGVSINDSLNVNTLLIDLFNENKIQDTDNFWRLARGSALSFIDQAWKDHLAEMDYLRSGIGLRAMGQRDPLVEYQNEGYSLFEDLISNVKYSVMRLLLNFDKSSFVDNSKNNEKIKIETIKNDKTKIGRNDPCPCGSGQKYKKCHG